MIDPMKQNPTTRPAMSPDVPAVVTTVVAPCGGAVTGAGAGHAAIESPAPNRPPAYSAGHFSGPFRDSPVAGARPNRARRGPDPPTPNQQTEREHHVPSTAPGVRTGSRS